MIKKKPIEGEVKLINGRPKQFVNGRWVNFVRDITVDRVFSPNIPASPLGKQSLKSIKTKKTKLKIY